MASSKNSSTWCYLKPGDTIDIIAPAFKFDEMAFEHAVQIIERNGFVARYPKNLMGRSLLFSNKDEVRWQHLSAALLAPDSKAIWCTRGGYGSNHMLPYLDKLKKKLKPKLIIGYSDITSLHYYFNNKHNWTTIHGALMESLGKETARPRDVEDTFNVINGYKRQMDYLGLKPINEAAKSEKNISGRVVGGNLAVLQSHIGTPWEYSLKGKVLFLEEIGERGYRIDKMLFQMQHSGFFNGVRAIVFGDITGGFEVSGQALGWPAIKQFFAESKIPVFKGMPCGHDIKKAPLLLGNNAVIYVNEKKMVIKNNGYHEESFLLA